MCTNPQRIPSEIPPPAARSVAASLGRLAWPTSIGLTAGFLLGSIKGSAILATTEAVIGAADGAWPPWVGNLANVLQILAPAVALMAWLIAQSWARRREDRHGPDSHGGSTAT